MAIRIKWILCLICLDGFSHAMAFDTGYPLKQKQAQWSDTATWINDFRLFRTAVYRHDTLSIKNYFRFPVLNTNNEIWYLVLSEKDMAGKKFTGKKPVPFLEKDLRKHFDKVFPASFIKSLLKVKTEVLYKKGYFETAELHEDSTTSCRIYVTYEKKNGTLTLNLAYNSIIKDEEGNILDGGESNVIYYFRVQKNGRLLFKEIRLAG